MSCSSLRHHFLLGVLVACAVAGGTRAVSAAAVEGYPTDVSVVQGKSLELHVSSEAASYLISIWRQGRNLELEPVANIGLRTGRAFAAPLAAWEGCHWPVTDTIPIPPTWRPGAYVARLETQIATTNIPFVVRAQHPGTFGPILVQLSTNTWQAYNRYGGKSLYGAFAPDLSGRAYKVSYHRPYDFFSTDGSGQLSLWEAPFLAWLESQGYAYEVCTNLDLHRNPHLLDPYRAFVSVGHDEYYSKEMYDELERFANSGGSLVFFSGNTLWWQVRFEGDGSLMVCYKDAALDPLTGVDNARVTVNWLAAPVRRPPAQLMGVAYNGSAGIPVGAYTVANPLHWAFAGTPVAMGQSFGYPMVGFEVDSRTVASPPNIDLIATTSLPDPNNGNVLRDCDMTYYERTPKYGFPGGLGGRVFACGSVNYVQGLMLYTNGWTRSAGAPDPIATQISRNVLDRLGCNVTAPELWAPSDLDVVTGERVLVQWRPSVAQRADYPVHYQVFWQAQHSGIDSLATDAPNAWLPQPNPSETVRWWVRSDSDCGATALSAVRRFGSRAPTDVPNETPPQLVVANGRDSVVFYLWTATPQTGRIEILDVAGRRVRDFAPLDLGAGRTRVDWDRRDARGLPVGSGVYFVLGHIGSTTARARVAVQKRD